MTKTKKILATNYKCVECGKQASAFWPVCGPDIPSSPYFRECLDKIKIKMMEDIRKMFEK